MAFEKSSDLGEASMPRKASRAGGPNPLRLQVRRIQGVPAAPIFVHIRASVQTLGLFGLEGRLLRHLALTLSGALYRAGPQLAPNGALARPHVPTTALRTAPTALNAWRCGAERAAAACSLARPLPQLSDAA